MGFWPVWLNSCSPANKVWYVSWKKMNNPVGWAFYWKQWYKT
jgi:hypothetical protein